MRKASIPLSPAVIGFVLGPLFEVNLRRTTMIAGDDPLGFLMGRPVTLVIFALILAALVYPLVQARLAGRRRVDQLG